MLTVRYPNHQPRATERSRWQGLGCLLLLLSVCSLVSVFIGAREIPASVTWQALTAYQPDNTEHLLVHHLRIPRTLLAIVAGSALGMAGALMQALTRNPLADPGLLGVNGGATLAIVAAIAFLGIESMSHYLWFGLGGAALAGAAVYLLGGVGPRHNPVRVVLAGTALSVVLLALTMLITVNANDEVFDRFRHWAVGSLQGRGYDVLVPVMYLIAGGLLVGLSLAKALDAMALGNDLGQAMGASPLRVWLLSALVIVVLAGAATAAAGPLSFIGLTAPHLARFFSGPNHRRLLPFSVLIAAILTVAADTLGRLISHPNEISVGIMAALLGGPFFVFLVKRWRLVQL